ncbi:hypothetical protein PRK78_000026 [Emydomyces testavorans]|uniref:RlpA-like protein double-psi beta-barrel domain-containing protein n=1 Tax=Emydomyces testavorans TaxID=2070801 RepID=A0AAF0DAX2_9EURO|nr:hypothetical protein PRK78_000026 [Emydomyces testavorans]
MLVVRAYLLFWAMAGMALAAPAPQPEAEADAGTELARREIQGKGTVYEQLGITGSCGKRHSDGDAIVALGNDWMKGRYNAPYCNRRIKASNKANGRSIIVPVMDTCMGCGSNDVDFSVAAWNRLTNNAPWGTFPLSWWGFYLF